MATYVYPSSATLMPNNYLTRSGVSIVVRDSNTHPSFPEENLLNSSRSKYWLVTVGTGGSVVIDLGEELRPTAFVLVDINGVASSASVNYIWSLTAADDSAMTSNPIEWYFYPTSQSVIRHYLGDDRPVGTVIYEASSIEWGTGLAIDTTGRIIMSAFSAVPLDFKQVRFLPSGVLDLSFGTGGAISTDFSSSGTDSSLAMDVDSSNRRVLVGPVTVSSEQRFGIMRFNEDGTLDTSFNTTGKQSHNFATGSESPRGIDHLSSGDIIVGGEALNGAVNNFGLIKVSTTGTVSANVLTNFTLTSAKCTSVLANAASNRIYAVGQSLSGSTSSEFAIAAYTTSLALDTGFSGDGKFTTTFGHSVPFDVAEAIVEQSDGKLVIGGMAKNATTGRAVWGMIRMTTTGTIDTTFGTNGYVEYDWGVDRTLTIKVLRMQGTSILAAGSAIDHGIAVGAIVRFNSNGSVDERFGIDGKALVNVGGISATVLAMNILTDGSILVAGQTVVNTSLVVRGFLSKFSSEGMVDTSFSSTVSNRGRRYWRLQTGYSNETIAHNRVGFMYLGDYVDIRVEPGATIRLRDNSDQFVSYNKTSYGDPVPVGAELAIASKHITRDEIASLKAACDGVGASIPVIVDLYANTSDDEDKAQGCLYGYLDRGLLRSQLLTAQSGEIRLRFNEVLE